ncbi:MAG: hypothetical protein ACI9OJ_002244 [Myxococcota bacterium]
MRYGIALFVFIAFNGCGGSDEGTACAELYGTVEGASATHHVGVGCQFATVAAALATATTGDAIIISPGTYRENITLTERVDLVGIGGPIVRGTITIRGVENQVVRDLTIAKSTGPGVVVDGGSATLDGVAVSEAASGSAVGHGLVITGGANVTLDNVSANGCAGSGVFVEAATVTMTSGTLRANVGGLVALKAATATLDGVAVTRNSTFGVANFGSSVTLQGQTVIRETLSVDDTPSGDGLVVVLADGQPGMTTANGLTLEANARHGALVDASSLVLANATLTGNGSTFSGAGIRVQAVGGTVDVTNSQITDSTGNGIIATESARLEADGVTVSGTKAAVFARDTEDFGDGIAVLSNAGAIITNCTIASNARAGVLFDRASGAGATFTNNSVSNNAVDVALQRNTATTPLDASAVESGFGVTSSSPDLLIDAGAALLPAAPVR